MSKELKAAIGRARRAILQAIILATGEDQLSATVSELLKALASRLPYQDGEQ